MERRRQQEISIKPVELKQHGFSYETWEVHGYSKPASGLSRTSGLVNKYGKLGLRCTYLAP